MPGMNWNDLLRTGLNGHRYPPRPPENNIIMSLMCFRSPFISLALWLSEKELSICIPS